MILFYSDYCQHSRMLKETIKRYDPNYKIIKFVSIDALRLRGQNLPPQIHSVPALVETGGANGTQVLYGKQVFDYLLLPGKGKLLAPPPKEQNEPPKTDITNEPLSFAFNRGQGYSDSFASFQEESQDPFMDKSYNWSAFGVENLPEGGGPHVEAPFQEETRAKKDTVDLDAYRLQRDMELGQNDLNNTPLPPPTTAR